MSECKIFVLLQVLAFKWPAALYMAAIYTCNDIIFPIVHVRVCIYLPKHNLLDPQAGCLKVQRLAFSCPLLAI
jgi:hypothetical protein